MSEYVMQQVKTLGVRTKSYTIVDFKKENARDIITTMIFTKNEELVEAGCLMAINCSSSSINEDISKVLDDANIVMLDDNVIVNDHSETNDDDIYALGSGTSFDRISAIRSRGIKANGAKVVKQMLKSISDFTDTDADDENDDSHLETFSTHQECHLPGGLCYLYLRKII